MPGLYLMMFFSLPLIICGVSGIVDAFRGRRALAVLSGILAGVPALVLSVWLSFAILSDPHRMSVRESFPIILLGLVPLAAGFWAVLLALLIPAKPNDPGPPPSPPRD